MKQAVNRMVSRENGRKERAVDRILTAGSAVLGVGLAEMIRQDRYVGTSSSDRSTLKPGPPRPPDGPLPGGRAAAAAQDDLYEMLRAQRPTGHAMPEVREQRAPTEGEGSEEGVAPQSEQHPSISGGLSD